MLARVFQTAGFYEVAYITSYTSQELSGNTLWTDPTAPVLIPRRGVEGGWPKTAAMEGQHLAAQHAGYCRHAFADVLC